MMEIKVVLVELLKKYRVTRGPETQVGVCGVCGVYVCGVCGVCACMCVCVHVCVCVCACVRVCKAFLGQCISASGVFILMS